MWNWWGWWRRYWSAYVSSFFDLPDLVIVLERLDLAERLLEPVLHSAGGPWMAVRLLHYSDESKFP